MKKIFPLLFVIACMQLQAQFVNSVTLLDSFSPAEVDSLFYIVSGQNTFNLGGTYAVKTYKVLYNTVSWDSTPTVASGLMCLPVGLPCKTGIISYQHGTTTQTNQVASFEAGSEWYISVVAASLGIVSIQPDYLGMGYSPIPLHPYQHAHTEATAVIDMIRATRDTAAGLGAPVDDQLFLMGYSQGGHATMAAHQLIQQTFDSASMHVTASAPMSGAYDMGGVMADLLTSGQPYPAPYYLPFLVLGYNEVYNLFSNDSDAFIHPYDTTLPPLFYNGGQSGGVIDAAMPPSGVPEQIMQPYQIDSFVNDSSTNFFRDTLKANDTYNWIPNSPIHMFFCGGDMYVPPMNAAVAYTHFIQNGTNPALIDTIDACPTCNHVPCAQYAILNATEWLRGFLYPALSTLQPTVVNDTSVYDTIGEGSIMAGIQGGNPPYTYAWNNGDSTQTINNLNAGFYSVTVTDRSACTISQNVIVNFVQAPNCVADSNITAQTICSGDTFYIGASAYTTSGIYIDTLANANAAGCDSIVILTLTVNPGDTSITSVAICNGDSALFNGTYYYTGGTYTADFTNVNGCDSLLIFSLTVNGADTNNLATGICSTDSILFNGVYYNTAGIYTADYTSVTGCDSLVILTLTVNTGDTSVQTLSICNTDSALFNGVYYNTTGTYTADFTNINGCDSLLIFNLTVTGPDTINFSQGLCNGDSVLFYGSYVYAAGTYDTLLSGGCDTLVVLNLFDVAPLAATQVYDTICSLDSVLFNGIYYNTSGVDSAHFSSIYGCDSLVILNLTVRSIFYDSLTLNLCAGGTFYIGNTPYTSTGNYTDTIQSAGGCDSVVNLALTVNPVPVVTLSFDSLIADSLFGLDTTQIIWCPNYFPYNIALTGGSPAGGTYSGVGVANDTFYNDLLPGYNLLDTITYAYTLAGCTGTAQQIVQITICIPDTTTKDTTGIGTLHAANAISLYPNPANNLIYTQTQGIHPQTIAIYDVDGRLVSTMRFAPEIDVHQLTPGVYLMEINSTEGLARIRWVKM